MPQTHKQFFKGLIDGYEYECVNAPEHRLLITDSGMLKTYSTTGADWKAIKQELTDLNPVNWRVCGG